MLAITRKTHIPDDELSWSFARSGGPGGQNVNKVNSKAVLRWSLAKNETLADDVKERLQQQQRRKITNDGEMIVTSQRYRDQERNRQDCLEKIKLAVLKAMKKPKIRKATKPSRGAREARLQAKRRRSKTKTLRRKPEGE